MKSPGRAPHRERKIVGGAFHPETGEMVENNIGELASPLAQISNLFRGVDFAFLSEEKFDEAAIAQLIGIEHQKGKQKISAHEDGEAKLAHIKNDIIPKLKSAVTAWTGNPAFANKVDVPYIIEVMRRIHTQDKARRDFSYSLLKSVKQSVFNANNGTPGTRRISAATLKKEPELVALFANLQNFNSSDPLEQERARRLANETLARIFKGNGWTFDGEILTPDTDILKSHRIASSNGGGNRATIEVFLRELHTSDGNAFEVIKKKVEATGGSMVLPSDQLVTGIAALQRAAIEKARGNEKSFLIDRPLRTGNSTPDKLDGRATISIGEPISRLLLLLRERDARDARKDEGVFVEFSPEFKYSSNLQSIEECLSHLLFQARRDAKYHTDERNLPGNSELVRLAEGMSKKITMPLITEIFEESRKELWKVMSDQEKDTTFSKVPFPDDFSALQSIFTTKLMEKVGFKEALATATDGTITEPFASGAWHADEVEVRLTSLELNENTGEKRRIVELFINHLPDMAETIAKNPARYCADCNAATLNKMVRAAQAFWMISAELRVGRLSMDDPRKKETANLLDKYAAAYGTLVRRGVVPQIPVHLPDPARLEDETDEQYQTRIAEVRARRAEKAQRERMAFDESQLETIAADLRLFLERIDTEDRLTGVFIGTLGQILNTQGAELKAKMRDRMQAIEEDPGLFEQAFAPQVYHMKHGRNASYAEKLPPFIQGALKTHVAEIFGRVKKINAEVGAYDTALRKIESSLTSTNEEGLIHAVKQIDVLERDFELLDPSRTLGSLTQQMAEKKVDLNPENTKRYAAVVSNVRNRIQSSGVEIERARKFATTLRITLLSKLVEAVRKKMRDEGSEGEFADVMESLDAQLASVRQSKNPEEAREALQFFL